MSITQQIREKASEAIQSLYGVSIPASLITVNQTKPEFEGDYTIVLFTMVKELRKSPDALGSELGAFLTEKNQSLFSTYGVIKGFLNLSISPSALQHILYSKERTAKKEGKTIIVEYSSPNTNKPLHLGHLRNNFLGLSVALILEELGNKVLKTCIVNDRGIHICKSMLAWQKFGNGETPETAGLKGDHLVGKYYVRFNDELKKEVESLTLSGLNSEEAQKKAPLMIQSQEMLVKWEKGDSEVMELWKTMNGWVYAGFDETYKRIGSSFDRTYYESNTYLLGREFVQAGLEQGVFFKKEDGSVWIDLSAEGLDEKLVLRKDGTSVYITQDLGLAHQKYEEYKYDESIYVIGDEQNYHMKVLQLILKKLNMPYAEGIYHLSYGMVELPTGKMKSREGTVVDADDLISEMVNEAKGKTSEKSKVEEFSETELKALYETIALGALKFFLLKVDPKKKMVFNPEESIDFHGFTGPFIQYTYARLKSILRRAGEIDRNQKPAEISRLERELILTLERFDDTLEEAGGTHSPAALANYVYALAKACNSFYTEHKVLKAESEELKHFRLMLCEKTAEVIKKALGLLGIQAPERM